VGQRAQRCARYEDIGARTGARNARRGAVAQNVGDIDKAIAEHDEDQCDLPGSFLAPPPWSNELHGPRSQGRLRGLGRHQVVARAQATAAKTTGLPLDKVVVHNHLIGGGFGAASRSTESPARPDRDAGRRPVKVIWSREEDIQHDMYRPYFVDRMSAGLDEGACRWPGATASPAPRYSPVSVQAFNNASTRHDRRRDQSALRLPNPRRIFADGSPGDSDRFWRSVGPSHNVFVVESFIDSWRLRRRRIGRLPAGAPSRIASRQGRPSARCGKGGLGTTASEGTGPRCCTQFVFGTYLARWLRSKSLKTVRSASNALSAVDLRLGRQSRHRSGAGAECRGLRDLGALFGKITLKDGRVEQTTSTRTGPADERNTAIEMQYRSEHRSSRRDG